MEATINSDIITVKVENLSRQYADTLAVSHLNFECRKGEVLGFLGPNGAGKSTSMQMITGNLAPTTGQVTINGFDLIDQPIEAKSCIGYLPEHPPLYRELTVDEYLKYCAQLHRIKKVQLKTALEEVKHQCGLEQVSHRLIGNLSKGFQQRVGIAQAIIHQPPVVILDEPTVGLDPIQIREIRHLIKSLGKDRSVILSTHILPEVQATCDRVQIIRNGELIYHASIDELNQYGQGNIIRVAFNSLSSTDALESVPGILQITELDNQRIQIQYQDDAFIPALLQQAVKQSWGLFELIPGNASLEEIFVELTTAEPVASLNEEEDAA